MGLKAVATATSVANITSGSITGVTIDNSVIGGTTPAAGTFTNLTYTGVLSGAAASAPTPSFYLGGDTTTGWYRSQANVWAWSDQGTGKFVFSGSTFAAFSSGIIGFLSGAVGTGADITLSRDAADTLALKRSTNPETLRIYGTTTGPKYLSLSHDGTDGIIDTAASAGKLKLAPTNASDIQWGKALVALGGGSAATLGTIGGSGPATAGQNTWMRVLDSTGAAFWVPAWK